MMKNLVRTVLLIFIFLISSLHAMSLDEIIAKALNQNHYLASITQRIAANQSNIDASDQFSNPTLSYAHNTLKSSEKMSRSTMSFQQKLPYFNKRDTRRRVAIAQGDVLSENLEQAKVSLSKAIKNQAYSIWESRALLQTIREYEKLTQQNIELFESYTRTVGNQHMGIMSAELTLSDLHIQKSTLEAKHYKAYTRLSYLASFEVKNLLLALHIDALPKRSELLEKLRHNHDLALREKKILKSQAMVKNAEINNYPDFNLLGAYNYRQNYDDYWSFSVGMTLPVYGTEDDKEEEARKLLLSEQSLKADTQVAINSEFESAYQQLKSAYKIYHIINNEALPQVEHMFDLTASSISTGGDLFKYIDILVKKLKLEQKSIMTVASYYRANAEILALSGTLK